MKLTNEINLILELPDISEQCLLLTKLKRHAVLVLILPMRQHAQNVWMADFGLDCHLALDPVDLVFARDA